MDRGHAAAWFREHRWLVAIAVMAVFGYTVGKDMALRDNRADAARIEAR